MSQRGAASKGASVELIIFQTVREDFHSASKAAARRSSKVGPVYPSHHARKASRSLPPDNPADAVDWNEEERRNTGMGSVDLKGWFAQLAALDNPVRREFHLFTLLCGSRPTALQEAKPEHINFRRRTQLLASGWLPHALRQVRRYLWSLHSPLQKGIRRVGVRVMFEYPFDIGSNHDVL